MKNIKFIPALALIVLLSACSGSRQATAKEPKFAKIGSEISFADYKAAFASQDIYGVFGEEGNLPSYAFKYNSSQKEYTDTKEGKKVLSSNEGKTQYLYDIKYDSKNLRASMREDSFGNSKNTANGKTGYSNMDIYIDMGYQISKVEGKDQIVIYEKSMKAYDIGKDVSEMSAEQRRQEFDAIAVDFLDEFMSDYISYTLNYYEGYSEEEKANYSFYKNGDIYTIKYAKTVETEVKDETTLLYKLTTVDEDCVQFEKTKNGLKFKSSELREETVEFSSACSYEGDPYKPGQVHHDNLYRYQDNSIEAKDVTVKEVDISKYSNGIALI